MRLTRRHLVALALLAPAGALAQAPRRIVSVGGTISEIVAALGAASEVVAIDSTTTYPPALTSLPNVGYVRALSAEPIIALKPDLVLISDQGGPPAVLQQLKDAGVRLEMVPDPPNADAVPDKVLAVARLLDRQQAGEALATALRDRLAQLKTAIAAAQEHPRVLFLMSPGRAAPMAAGTHTAADAIINLAAGRNAVVGYSGYKPLTPEAAVLANPDVVLVMQQSADAMGGAHAVLELPQLRQTKAAAGGRVVAIEGQLLLGFGPRTPEALHQLAAALHPGLALPQ